MRTARKQGESGIYHIVARGVGQQIIFETDSDRIRYLDSLQKLVKESECNLLAWCLMDNHVHLLLAAPLEELSNLMRRLNSGYALYFNLVHERSGHLFQDRFHSEPIDSDSYLMTVVRYIHQNPIKARMTTDCRYPWSSYNEYASGNVPPGGEIVMAVFGNIDSFVSSHETLEQKECLDISQRNPRVDDAHAETIAINLLGSSKLRTLKSLPREERNQALASLKASGLTTRQIRRLTGVSLGVISQA